VARLITLVRLRSMLAWRRLRGRGLADAIVGLVMTLIAAAVAVGLALAVGRLARKAATVGDGEAILVYHLVVCYLLALIAIVVPVIVGRDGQTREVVQLVHFPIGRRAVYGLNLLAGAGSESHILWYPALVAFVVQGPLRIGNGGAVFGVLLTLLLGFGLVVWSQTVLHLVAALLRRRSVREVVIIAAFVLFMATALMPALVDSGVFGAARRPPALDVLIDAARPVVAVLPPSRVAHGLTALYGDAPVALWGLVAELLAWIAAGVVLGYLVLSRVLLDGGSGGGPVRRRSGRTSPAAREQIDLLAWLPNGVAAVVSKEVRYLLRSTPGKLALLIAPMFVVMIALAVGRLRFAERALLGIEPAEYALYGVMLYVAALTANCLVNAFAWDGPGFVAYTLNPLRARDIVLGKNLGVWIVNLLLLGEGLVVWTLIRGWPGLAVATTAVLVFAVGVLIQTMLGNFVSIRFPVRRSMAALGNSSSQVGTVATMGALVAAGLLSGLALVLGLALGGHGAQLCLMAALVAALAVGTWLLLQPAADLLDARSEELVAAMEAQE
jgi:hypothetical protein